MDANSDFLDLIRFLQRDTFELLSGMTTYCRVDKSANSLQSLLDDGKITLQEATDKLMNVLTQIGKLNFYVVNVKFSNTYVDMTTLDCFISDDSIIQQKPKDCSVFNCLAFEYTNLAEKYGDDVFKKFTEDFLRHNVM